MREGVWGRNAIWGTEGEFFEREKEKGKLGHAFEHLGKLMKKRGEREMSQAVKAH